MCFLLKFEYGILRYFFSFIRNKRLVTSTIPRMDLWVFYTGVDLPSPSKTIHLFTQSGKRNDIFLESEALTISFHQITPNATVSDMFFIPRP